MKQELIKLFEEQTGIQHPLPRENYDTLGDELNAWKDWQESTFTNWLIEHHEKELAKKDAEIRFCVEYRGKLEKALFESGEHSELVSLRAKMDKAQREQLKSIIEATLIGYEDDLSDGFYYHSPTGVERFTLELANAILEVLLMEVEVSDE